MAFQSKPFRGSAFNNTAAAKYRVAVQKHPFLLFGAPFILIMVAGSFFLTPATALRYVQHDKKVKQLSEKDAKGVLAKERKPFDIREEYYRLAAKDLDNWEQKRVKRLPGEPDGVI